MDQQGWRERDSDVYAAAWQSDDNDILFINDRYRDRPDGNPRLEDFATPRYEIGYKWRFAPEPRILDKDFEDIADAYRYAQRIMDGDKEL